MPKLRLSFVVLLAAVLLAPGAAFADGDDPSLVEMPAVVGNDAARARTQLEDLGLVVEVVTIAGSTPDLVERQAPASGTSLSRGAEVVLHVTVRSTVRTLVPDFVGSMEADAVDGASAAYVVDVAYVDGDPAQAGTVVSQTPPAGRELLVRGVLVLQVVRTPLLVPRLLGRSELEARAIASGLWLILDVRYVPASTAPVGQVVSQDPRSGAEILPGGVVQVQVSGDGPATAPDQITMPDLVGRALVAAQHLLLDSGLVPHFRLTRTSRFPHLTVMSQEDAPGTVMEAGAETHFAVAIARTPPASMRLPTLVGMDRRVAESVASALGFRTRVERIESPLRPDFVISHDPAPASRVDSGIVITLVVARRATSTDRVRVPDVVGLTGAAARSTLLASGLRVVTRRRLAPDRPADRVAEQDPEEGVRADAGAIVTLTLPLLTHMPNLIGKTSDEAIQLLALAGLIPDPSGPASARGRTEVVRQGTPAGNAIARASTVRFHFRDTGVVSSGLLVPDVVGLELNVAKNRVLAAGISVSVRGPAGWGTAWVVSQSIAGGSRVSRGTILGLRYVFGIAPPIGSVVVPDLRLLTVRQARNRLRPLGLVLGTPGPDGAVVTSQVPLAGTRVRVGSTVNVGIVSGVPPGTTRVPNLIGSSVPDARAALALRGLSGVFHGPLAIGTRVTSQSPIAGTVVATGTVVQVTYVPALGPGLLVAVPNVEGLTRRRAVSRLEAAGFVARVVGIDIHIGNVRSKVKDQDPEGGTLLARGSTVRVELGL